MPVGRPQAERLLRPREFCEAVGISYKTFLRWVDEGRIRAVRTPSGRYRVPYSELERILRGEHGGNAGK